MKKNHVFYVFAATTLLLTASCSSNDITAPPDEKTPEEKGKEIAILSFDSETDFYVAAGKIKNLEDAPGAGTRAVQYAGFRSIFDEFDEAMSVADEYYNRVGGYEEFKQRFPNLYYPEYGEDYSAFLPVSDESVAKLLNNECEVRIGDKVRNMRDVFSYDKIKELGLAMPEKEDQFEWQEEYQNHIETRAVHENIPEYEKNELTTGKKTFGKTKGWITMRGLEKIEKEDGKDVKYKIARADLCFRKKGIVHWYNGRLTSRSFIIVNEPYYPFPKKVAPYRGAPKSGEYSPHKYYLGAVTTKTLDNFPSNASKTLRIYFHVMDKNGYKAYHDFLIYDAYHLNNGGGFGSSVADFFKKGSYEIYLAYDF